MITPIKPASELAAEIQGKVTEEQDANPKERREWSFHFEFKDDHGKIWKGPFTNQCLSPNQKLQVGVIKASLLGRISYEALDAYTRELAERIAHMTVSLIKRPDWARELGDLMDENIIHKLYEEVLGHEATFHRRKSDQTESSETESGGDRGTEDVASQ